LVFAVRQHSLAMQSTVLAMIDFLHPSSATVWYHVKMIQAMIMQS